MTIRKFNPPTIREPFGSYSHGVAIGPNARWLYSAGQVGVAADGTIPADFETQAHNAFSNLTVILEADGMGWEDVVKMTIFITRAEDGAALAPIRAAIAGECKPASTLLRVAGLARPEFLVEIEITAAKI